MPCAPMQQGQIFFSFSQLFKSIGWPAHHRISNSNTYHHHFKRVFEGVPVILECSK